MSTPLFQKLVVDDLKVSAGFLNEQDNVLRQKIKSAAQEMQRDHGDIFAINQCLHLAASVVLSRSETIDKALNVIRNDDSFDKIDPTTVLVVATFYYLLRFQQKKHVNSTEDTEDLTRITQRFESINWLVGEPAKAALGISELVQMSEES